MLAGHTWLRRHTRLRLSLRLGLAIGAISVVAGLLLAGCSAARSDSGRLEVVGAENFYGDMLGRIGGDLVSATSILSDPNVDPHTYETNSQSAAAVAGARLVVENGLGYDAFVDRLIAASPRSDRVVVNVGSLLGLSLGADPHVWYDPTTMPRVARAVEAEMARLDSANASAYQANLSRYLDSLAPLAAEVAAVRAAHAGEAIACTEPVPDYLAGALGLRVLTPPNFAKAIEDGTDPAPADVAAMRDLLTGHAVKLLLYNTQATSPVTDSIRALAVQSGIPVVGVSETMPASAGSFAAWQVGQLDQIANALSGGRA